MVWLDIEPEQSVHLFSDSERVQDFMDILRLSENPPCMLRCPCEEDNCEREQEKQEGQQEQTRLEEAT